MSHDWDINMPRPTIDRTRPLHGDERSPRGGHMRRRREHAMRVERVERSIDGVTTIALALGDDRRMTIDVMEPAFESVDWQVGIEVEGLVASFQFVAISPWLAYEQAVDALRDRPGLRDIDWAAIRRELDAHVAFLP
jgi:hypothetical protein